MKKLIRSFIGLICISTIYLTGCEERVVATKPDEVKVERTAPPFSGAVWIDNEYRWDGRTYVIVPAHWSKPNGTWVPGHWKQSSKGYAWIPGHWTR